MPEDVDLKKLVAKVAAAYFANRHVNPSEISKVIDHIAVSLGSVGAPRVATVEAQPETPRLTSAQIRNSITQSALISFEDNKPYKTLRRHLAARGLTPEQYREKWGLPEEYPVVAPSYSEARAQIARSFGFGGPALEFEKGRKAAAASRIAPQIPLPATDVVRPPEAASVELVDPTQPEGRQARPPNVQPVRSLPSAPVAAVENLTSAQIEQSITPEVLISFEDGKPYKQLKRHLAVRGMTPQDYRAKWGLPADYPMVAANLSAARSAVAVRSGFGKAAQTAPPLAQPETLAPAASSIAQAQPAAQAATPDVADLSQAEEPTKSSGSAPAPKPAKARIPGRLSFFRRRPATT